MRGVFRLLLRAGAFGFKLLVAAGILLAAAGLVFALGLWLSVESDFRTAEVLVPDVVNLSVEEATAKAEAAHLVLAVEARRPHEGTEAGRIFFQEPLAGMKSRRSRQVKVVVSTGSAREGVPELGGLSPRKAVVLLSEAKLRLGEQVQVHSDRHESGTIIAQDPPAGASDAPGGEVDVLVSLGPLPRAYVMPDLRGFTRDKVEAVLASVGIRVGEVREQAVGNLAAGLIAAQQPSPGSRITPDTAVSLVLSRPIEAGTNPGPRVE